MSAGSSIQRTAVRLTKGSVAELLSGIYTCFAEEGYQFVDLIEGKGSEYIFAYGKMYESEEYDGEPGTFNTLLTIDSSHADVAYAELSAFLRSELPDVEWVQ